MTFLGSLTWVAGKPGSTTASLPPGTSVQVRVAGGGSVPVADRQGPGSASGTRT